MDVGMVGHNAGATISAREAKGVYDFLSGYVHPTVYISLDMFAADLGGRLPGRDDLATETVFLERLASAGICSFYNAMSYLMSSQDG